MALWQETKVVSPMREAPLRDDELSKLFDDTHRLVLRRRERHAADPGLTEHLPEGKLPAYGTNVLTNILNEAGGYPTYNFKEGRFAGADKISGETEAELETARGGLATHGCHRGCIIRCSGIYHDKDGHFLTKQPEYETVWAHGGHCGIDDLDAIAMMDFLDDNFGLDTIEMGVTIGVAMEAGSVEIRRC